MVCYCLDLREDSKLSRVLANKLFSLLTAVIQLVLWFMTLLSLMIQPDYMKERIQNLPSGYLAVGIIFIIIIVAFSCLLLFGLIKGHRGFMKTYLIFNIVLSVLLVLDFFTSLFTQPGQVGAGGFVGIIFIILLNVLFYFVIRNYYLAFINKSSNHNPA